jgi:hypothetical protein
MNKFLSLSVIPLAATATVASVMMASAPAQAINIGQVAVSGNALFVNPLQVALSNVTVELDVTDATGIFGGLQGTAVTTVSPAGDLFFDGAGNYNAVPNFFTFANGITFDLDAGDTDFFGMGNAVELALTGTFKSGTSSYLGTGNFAILTSGAGASSFNGTFEAVPEPLTILGTGLALGFGGLFKSKSSKKQSVKA